MTASQVMIPSGKLVSTLADAEAWATIENMGRSGVNQLLSWRTAESSECFRATISFTIWESCKVYVRKLRGQQSTTSPRCTARIRTDVI